MEHLDTLVQNYLRALGWPAEAMVQLLMAAMAGGVIGIEREIRGRQAGFRTNLLVCVGSALVMICSIRMGYHVFPPQPGVEIRVDPSRIAYGIMTGIGFLGAGTIIKDGINVRGLTTAAGLWCVAALGMAAGQGLYILLAFATFLLITSLWLLDYLANLLPRLHYREVTLRRRWEPGCVAETVQRLKTAGLRVVDAKYRRTDNLHDVDIRLRIAFTEKAAFYAFENHLSNDGRFELLSVDA